MNHLRALAIGQGLCRKQKLWSKVGRTELEALVLDQWASILYRESPLPGLIATVFWCIEATRKSFSSSLSLARILGDVLRIRGFWARSGNPSFHIDFPYSGGGPNLSSVRQSSRFSISGIRKAVEFPTRRRFDGFAY
jgi:hypothetical protein